MVGETGSGKTTLGRLVARFTDPTSARSISVGGVDLRRGRSRRAAPSSRRRVAGAVPLRRHRSSRTSRSPRPAELRDEIEAVVADLGATDWIDSLADGLLTSVGERGEPLSAGERQLVALLRAGLADPDVLDPRRGDVVGRRAHRGSHRPSARSAGRGTDDDRDRPPLSTAARADRVLVLGRRPSGRGRPPRRTHRRRRHLPPAVRRLDLATTVSKPSDRSVRVESVEAERARPVDGADAAVEIVEATGPARRRMTRCRRPRRRRSRPVVGSCRRRRSTSTV